MAEWRFRISIRKQLLTTAIASVLGSAIATHALPTFAQSSDGVSINFGVLDDLDPRLTVPRLLMPSAQPRSGRIILTPPAGVDPITPQQSRIVLRPPPGAPTRVTLAPKIAVPQPAAAALTPPMSVTAAPPPSPAPAAAQMEKPGDIVSVPAETIDAAGLVVTATSETTETPPAASEQIAALPDSSDEIGPVSVLFGMDETELPLSATSALIPLADQLKSEDALRVQLLAYASSAEDSPSSVRRKSLSRALSVREFLIDQGVNSTRIEVRALGDQNEGGNPDRVDAVLERR
jgi:outer membrane protein OmpA-like peptidoglycan-associated protein